MQASTLWGFGKVVSASSTLVNKVRHGNLFVLEKCFLHVVEWVKKQIGLNLTGDALRLMFNVLWVFMCWLEMVNRF